MATRDDPDVERLRRNHLNDIENIVPFVLVGFFYVATNPHRDVAYWHFRVFFLSRVVHTVCYQVWLPHDTFLFLGELSLFLLSRCPCPSPVDFSLVPSVTSPRCPWPCKFYFPPACRVQATYAAVARKSSFRRVHVLFTFSLNHGQRTAHFTLPTSFRMFTNRMPSRCAVAREKDVLTCSLAGECNHH